MRTLSPLLGNHRSPVSCPAASLRPAATDVATAHRALHRDSTDAIRLVPNDDDAYYRRGSAHFNRKAYALAGHDGTAALIIHPGHIPASLHRGQRRRQLDDYTAAMNDFTRFLRFQPARSEGYHMCRHVICISNQFGFTGILDVDNNFIATGPDTADLIIGQTYAVLAIECGWYRLVDESGEDYLYPPKLFQSLDDRTDDA